MTGVHLKLLIGPTIAVPAPRLLMESLQSVEVTHNDTERSGFQIVFRVGRSGIAGVPDYRLIHNPLLRTFNRVILTLTINATAQVLMDGVITHQQFSPSPQPGQSTFTITGEDVSVMMDQKERSESYPAQNEGLIVLQLIARYAQYGLIPMIIPPLSLDNPLPVERIPSQQNTDLKFINELAERYAYVFYIKPGPVTGTNTAYWGPPIRFGIPQKALNVNMGGYTNVESINVQNNSQAATQLVGFVQDRLTNRKIPVRTFSSLRVPLAVEGALKLLPGRVRQEQFRETGRSILQALSHAQANTDRSMDNIVTVSGELDSVRYGGMLQARQLVGLRGIGYTHDGLYYVKSVTHRIQKGEYKQSFTITREGIGTTVPAVRV